MPRFNRSLSACCFFKLPEKERVICLWQCSNLQPNHFFHVKGDLLKSEVTLYFNVSYRVSWRALQRGDAPATDWESGSTGISDRLLPSSVVIPPLPLWRLEHRLSRFFLESGRTFWPHHCPCACATEVKPDKQCRRRSYNRSRRCSDRARMTNASELGSKKYNFR